MFAPPGSLSILHLCAPGTASRDCHSRFSSGFGQWEAPPRGEYREQVNGGIYSSAPSLSEVAFLYGWPQLCQPVSACVNHKSSLTTGNITEGTGCCALKPIPALLQGHVLHGLLPDV